jgi:hypothetical protein
VASVLQLHHGFVFQINWPIYILKLQQ